jgi:hypothetical protein
MAKYDPYWLAKLQTKKFAEQERSLSHLLDPKQADRPHPGAICGKGWGAKGHPSILTVQFPSVDNLPGCRQCRELFLAEQGIEINPLTGYPNVAGKSK